MFVSANLEEKVGRGMMMLRAMEYVYFRGREADGIGACRVFIQSKCGSDIMEFYAIYSYESDIYKW